MLQIRTAYVTADSKGKVEVTAGLKDLKASGVDPCCTAIHAVLVAG